MGDPDILMYLGLGLTSNRCPVCPLVPHGCAIANLNLSSLIHTQISTKIAGTIFLMHMLSSYSCHKLLAKVTLSSLPAPLTKQHIQDVTHVFRYMLSGV